MHVDFVLLLASSVVFAALGCVPMLILYAYMLVRGKTKRRQLLQLAAAWACLLCGGQAAEWRLVNEPDNPYNPAASCNIC